MSNKRSFGLLPIFVLVSGCLSLQAGGEAEKGRAQLMFGDPKAALTHFQRAAEIDPAYRYNLSVLSQDIWTYVGRAYYATGKLPDARQALERALSRDADDHMARLYLGLVLTRDGDKARGLKEISAGLRGLSEWFDRLDRYHPDARFWDPGRQIRPEIERTLVSLSGKEFNWPEIIASGEWLGKALEDEIDLAARDRFLEETGNGDKREE